ncbi:hypothetical protein OMP38_04755 [Cohnella ginsengisoli]|uniref:Uncharacterized protein n=1 Tax=Cohnella ginsengisoli TaxID=425004 RepID=A0A9X4QL91_9BACL|nr:hypothetical protein [Cohnella ginsengisoli]MDG0790235.1 hypothetical protein [Cohnella ginsengisoli]
MTFVYAYFTNDIYNRLAAEMWLVTRFIVESILVVLLIVFLVMKKKGFVKRIDERPGRQSGGASR